MIGRANIRYLKLLKEGKEYEFVVKETGMFRGQ